MAAGTRHWPEETAEVPGSRDVDNIFLAAYTAARQLVACDHTLRWGW